MKTWTAYHDDGRICTIRAKNDKQALQFAMEVFVEYDQNKVSVS